MGAITQQFQDFARENGGGLIKLEIKANREKEPEPPIRSTIEALQIMACRDCEREAKISPPLAMSAYTCPLCGIGQYNGHGESSVSIGKTFKLRQENATTGNSSSPPRDWFSRERSRSRGCPTSSTCRAAPSEGGRRNMRPTARTRSPEAATPSQARITRYRSSRRRTGAPQGGRDTEKKFRGSLRQAQA